MYPLNVAACGKGIIRVGVCVVSLMTCAAGFGAEAELRWKFTPGETIHYVMTMNMVQEMNVNGKPLATKMVQNLDMTWAPESVAEDGTIELKQTMDRIRMEMIPPVTDPSVIKIDSEGESTAKEAAVLQPMLKAMVHQPFTMKITPLGELSEVKFPPEMMKALKDSVPAGMPPLFSEDSLKQMMGRAMFTFPETLTEGQSWETVLDMPNPILGKQKVIGKYTYLGPTEVDGKKLEKLGVKMELSFVPEEDAKVSVEMKDQTSDGQILFDNVHGHPYETNMTSSFTMVISIGDQQIESHLTTVVDMKEVTPETEAASAEPEPKE